MAAVQQTASIRDAITSWLSVKQWSHLTGAIDSIPNGYRVTFNRNLFYSAPDELEEFFKHLLAALTVQWSMYSDPDNFKQFDIVQV